MGAPDTWKLLTHIRSGGVGRGGGAGGEGVCLGVQACWLCCACEAGLQLFLSYSYFLFHPCSWARRDALYAGASGTGDLGKCKAHHSQDREEDRTLIRVRTLLQLLLLPREAGEMCSMYL